MWYHMMYEKCGGISMGKTIKMSLKDILNKTDVIMRKDDIVYICNDIDVIKKFISRFNNGEDNRENVKKFLLENEKYIDKEKFILITVKNYRENIEILEKNLPRYVAKISNQNIPESFSKLSNIHTQLDQQRENLEQAIKLGKGIVTVFTYYYYDEEQNRYRVGIVDSREVIDGKKINTAKATKRFDEVDLDFKGGKQKEKLGLEFALQSILLTDLYHIFSNEQFGNEIRTMILENQVLKMGLKTRKELEELKTLETYDEYTEIIDGIAFDGLLPDIKVTLREYSEYIDMDKLLLTSAYRFNEALENNNINPKIHLGVKEILQGILNNIKSNSAHISCKLQNKLDYSYKLEQVNYEVKDIKECLSRFAGNTYLTSKQIQEYKEQINNGEVKLLDIPEKYVDLIISEKELKHLSLLSPENLIYVYKKQNWDVSRIIELYEENYISLESIKRIQEDITLSDNISLEKLNLYYQLTKEENADEEASNKYKRYLELYKEIFLNEKSKEEIEQISNEIMELIVEKFKGKQYNQAIKDYLQNGILTLHTVAEWVDESFITELYNESLISLENIEMLAKEQKVSLEYLSEKYIQLINEEEMEYKERLRLIRSGYVSEVDIFDLYKRNLIFENDLSKLAEDKFVRYKEMQRVVNSRTMEELEKKSAIRLTGLNGLSKKNNDIYACSSSKSGQVQESELTGKFIIDPNERERFLRLLRAYKADTDLEEDSPFYNYEFYVIPDESGTIGLNSVVIAERYFEDKYAQRRFATDNATYFFKYKDLMVLSNLKKNEMTKERKDIVFTANHVIANEKREGSWAKSVLSSLAKTMMSCDLKEYNKRNQQIIIRQKLKDIYTAQELNDILCMATEIDAGAYIGEIEEPVITVQRKTKITTQTSKKIEDISDDTECR